MILFLDRTLACPKGVQIGEGSLISKLSGRVCVCMCVCVCACHAHIIEDALGYSCVHMYAWLVLSRGSASQVVAGVFNSCTVEYNYNISQARTLHYKLCRSVLLPVHNIATTGTSIDHSTCYCNG